MSIRDTYGRPRKSAIIDVETGEIGENYLLISPTKVRIGDFMMVFLDELKSLAKNKALTASELYVLFALCSHINFENWIFVSQKEIAEELGMGPTNVSRAIRNLVESGIIHRHPTRQGYRLDLKLGWRGKARNYLKATSQIRREGLNGSASH